MDEWMENAIQLITFSVNEKFIKKLLSTLFVYELIKFHILGKHLKFTCFPI